MENNINNAAAIPSELSVNGVVYKICSLLGKGKGGYSYLATDGQCSYVLKQIHHEPCSYYTFGNKIESELRDYDKLVKIGILLPKLYDADIENERILKEYIDGPTAAELAEHGEMQNEYIEQIRAMCSLLYPANINIDYYPTNFVLKDGKIFYIDYECNEYMEQWDFEHWGIKYWLNKK